MKANSKVKILKKKIADCLLPLLDHDYVLYGLPYYTNIGDTLIWEGELELLREVPFKCLGVCGLNEVPKVSLSKDTIILITGGGYWGDVWRKSFENMLEAIKDHLDNKIIFLPASMHYENKENIEKDASFLSKFHNLTICARDKVSFDFAQKYFSNSVMLVPDMAFYIKESYLRQWMVPTEDKNLFLKRKDKELSDSSLHIYIKNAEVHDWPTMENEPSFKEKLCYKILYEIERFKVYCPRFESQGKLLRDYIYYSILRPCMTQCGVRFISSYKKIYTTRLHVLILSVLLEKKVEIIDNSYGKLSSYYNTWLSDVDNISFYDSKENEFV